MIQPRRILLHHTQPLTSLVCQLCFFDLTLEQGKDEVTQLLQRCFTLIFYPENSQALIDQQKLIDV
jgi:hypothetical protein